jgi:hypothetical protein
MHSYTEAELKEMTRLDLKKAAIDTLHISNAEARNTKGPLLIEKILEKLAEGGNGDSPAEEPKKAAKRTNSRKTRKPGTVVAKDAAVDLAPTNGLGKLVDAVGKAVDDTKEELAAKSEEMMENLEHVMKQQFILFGVLCDIFKAVNEPDELEPRLEELETEWDAQGNEG